MPSIMTSTATKTSCEESDTLSYMRNFQNILEKGKEPDMTKAYNPKVAQQFERYLDPTSLKRHVCQSEKIQKLIDLYAKAEDRPRSDVERQVKRILDEIGLDRNMAVIRWCGIAITAIGKRITSGIYVNEKNLGRVKDGLGQNPVLYLPSHRSYCDFILMSYICFHYDIEIPGIAAGMAALLKPNIFDLINWMQTIPVELLWNTLAANDLKLRLALELLKKINHISKNRNFHEMFGMGKMLRKTGAFFMRRSFSGEELYWDVFREYMYALVSSYHIGAEFFIEGTRSRNFKALVPKVGLLSMALLPFFTGEVADITIVPVSVSYDRVLEEQLFVYELLGVPKPKETTRGFFKALKIIEERFGRMYVDFGEPISAKEFFGDDTVRIQRASLAGHLQKLNKDEVRLIKELANEVVYEQQRRVVITTFNLVALFYTYCLNCERPVNLDELSRGVLTLKSIFEKLGAHVDTNENAIKLEIIKTVEIHSNVVTFHKANLKLVPPTGVDMKNIDVKRLKGHALSQQTMTLAVPVLHMQIYINPCMFWLAKPSFAVLAAMKMNANGCQSSSSVEQLEENFAELCNIFKHEFITERRTNENELLQILTMLRSVGVLNRMDFSTNDSSRLLLSAIAPFLCIYYQLAVTLIEHSSEEFTAKDALVQTQKRIEDLLTSKSELYVHPYCLALDNLNIALQSFVQGGYLAKTKDATTFSKVPDSLQHLRTTLQRYCELLPFRRLYEDTPDRFPSKL